MAQSWAFASAAAGSARVPDGGSPHISRHGAKAPHRRAHAVACVMRAFLAHPQLCNVPVDAVKTLIESGYEKTWLHGERLLWRKQPCSEILIVLDGALQASWAGSSGERLVIEYIPPNEVINIIPALDGRGSMSDFRAHGTTRVFHVPREALLNVLERSPALVRGLFGLICSRSRKQISALRILRFADFRHRLARRLLDLADMYGEPVEDGVEIKLKLSQDDLASLLGVSRQSINKELRNFSSQGWVSIRYSRLTIFDREALRLVCEANE